MKLESEQLVEVWEAFRKGDSKAKDRLLIHYIPIVQHMAGRLKVTLPASVQYEDLHSCGVLGLIRAIENFDSSRGFKFETYAAPVIRGAMLDGLREYDWLPRSQRVRNRRIEQAIIALEQRLGRSPEDAEVAAELGIQEDEYQQYLAEAGAGLLFSLDNEMYSSDSEGSSFHDVVADTEGSSPLEDVELHEVREIARELLAELPAQSRKVMALYYFEDLTLKEIGTLLNITESRVCQIHSKVILLLRARIVRIFDTTLEPEPEVVKRPRGRPRKSILSNILLPTGEVPQVTERSP